MNPMTANELRRAFLQFFENRGHHVVPSASLIPHDPDLLFTVAGMVPFKPYFLGEEQPPYPRATSVQKCVRAGGKDSDLEEVGRDDSHLSFFEMLGNFSFGDYFKDEAIPLAWDMVTNLFGLDPEQLWVTVHTSDDEAEEIWRDAVGVRPDRIQRLGADNWWGPPGGPPGPCGPCSEIYVDLGADKGDDGGPAHGSEARFLEIWNLVFMQFNRDVDGVDAELPKKNIDTGAGLERILGVLQGKDTVWDIDVMAPLVEAAQSVTGRVLGALRGVRRVAAHPRRARPDDELPGQRRRLPVQRGPGLRAAPHHPSRRAPCLPARRRPPGDAPAGRHHRRGDGRGLPRPGQEPRLRAQRGGPGGGALPPDPQAGHGHPRRRARAAVARAIAWRAPPPSCCTTPTASRWS